MRHWVLRRGLSRVFLKGGLSPCATCCRRVEAQRISPPEDAASSGRSPPGACRRPAPPSWLPVRRLPSVAQAASRFFLRRNSGALFSTRKASLALITVWRLAPRRFARPPCFSGVLPPDRSRPRIIFARLTSLTLCTPAERLRSGRGVTPDPQRLRRVRRKSAECLPFAARFC